MDCTFNWSCYCRKNIGKLPAKKEKIGVETMICPLGHEMVLGENQVMVCPICEKKGNKA